MRDTEQQSKLTLWGRMKRNQSAITHQSQIAHFMCWIIIFLIRSLFLSRVWFFTFLFIFFWLRQSVRVSETHTKLIYENEIMLGYCILAFSVGTARSLFWICGHIQHMPCRPQQTSFCGQHFANAVRRAVCSQQQFLRAARVCLCKAAPVVSRHTMKSHHRPALHICNATKQNQTHMRCTTIAPNFRQRCSLDKIAKIKTATTSAFWLGNCMCVCVAVRRRRVLAEAKLLSTFYTIRMANCCGAHHLLVQLSVGCQQVKQQQQRQPSHREYAIIARKCIPKHTHPKYSRREVAKLRTHTLLRSLSFVSWPHRPKCKSSAPTPILWYGEWPSSTCSPGYATKHVSTMGGGCRRAVESHCPQPTHRTHTHNIPTLASHHAFVLASNLSYKLK